MKIGDFYSIAGDGYCRLVAITGEQLKFSNGKGEFIIPAKSLRIHKIFQLQPGDENLETGKMYNSKIHGYVMIIKILKTKVIVDDGVDISTGFTIRKDDLIPIL